MDNYIKRFRRKKRLSQEDLAKKVLCSQITISNLERSIFNPRLTLAMRIAEVLEVKIEELFVLDFEDRLRKE